MQDHKTNSDLEKIIPPEIKEDEFYFDLLELARNEVITTVLEIGSSAGSGSTEALVRGLRENPNAPHLYCVEISRSRLNELKKRYVSNPFVHCYNVSSVPIDKFPSEKDIENFYWNFRTNLNNYPLQKVIGWLQQDIEYISNTKVPSAGIQIIKNERRIKCFDMVLIDGSEFSGKADLEEVYGSKIILLDDINSYKNYENYCRLKNDPHYLLFKENWKLRNGYAIFKKITSQHLTYASVKKEVESVEGYLCPGQEEFLFNKVKSLPDNAVIVEIGSYKGRATVAMSYACIGTNRRIFSIDTWDGNESDFHERDFYNVWKENIKINGLEKHVIPLRGNSHEILKKWSDLTGGLDIDFIFIDGSHQYDDVLGDFILSFPLVSQNGTIAFHDVVHTRPGPERVWNEIAKQVLTDHQYSTSLACGRKKIEKSQPSTIHFFTIVLNGMPFIRHHINVLKQLPFNWHWHIVEGVADFKHDTSWCYRNGGRVEHSVHQFGLSNDGTSEYLDRLAIEQSDRITLYRKSDGAFWDGKLEMVNAPLGRINEPCILWQVDSDELWTAEQIVKVKRMFEKSPEKTAAYFHCHFFVGPDLVTITPNSYSHNNTYEWLRVWRFEPGMKWLSHEPPCLASLQENRWVDTAKINPFRHEETAAEGLVFTHYAYATEAQVRFKETYYGYQNAVSQWRSLQEEDRFPLYLHDYFCWVKDNTQVDRVENRTIGRSVKPVEWKIPRIEIQRDYLATDKSPVVMDGVIFQLQAQRSLGISRVWRSLLPNLLKLMGDRPVILLRRGSHSAKIAGLREVEIPLYRLGPDSVLDEDDAMLSNVCRELNCGVFLSTYYTRAPGFRNILMVHDLIPEAMGFDLHQPEWRSKIRAIDSADSFVAVSDFTHKDLLRFYPQIQSQRIITSHNGVSSDFYPASEEEITSFKSNFKINYPYFLMVGNRDHYKNADAFFRAFTNIESHKDLQILAVGGEPHLILEEQRHYGDFNLQVIPWLEDDNMRIAYSGALALIYLSSYEGFGLPVLEALASGCPVITTRSASIPEVCGESAVYIASGRTDDIHEAVRLVQNRNVRENLKRTGYIRAKTFTWEAAAERFVDVINNIDIESNTVKTVDRPVEAKQLRNDKNCSKEFFNRDNRKIAVHTNGHQQPLVSAIVSTYNAEKYIKGCLEDLENQTVGPKLEIIVVNSGSQQNEEAIVNEFQKKYANIKYIRTEYRENVYAAWNRGIRVASGRYITNANTDDRHRPDAFEIMARALEENSAVGAVYADSLITNNENETFENNTARQYFNRPNFNLRQMLLFSLFGPHPMWRSSVHKKIGYFDESLSVAADYDFFIRLAHEFGALHIGEILGLYTRRSHSIENSSREKCVSETLQLLRHYRNIFPLEDIYPDLKTEREPDRAFAACLADQGNCRLFGDLPDIESALACYNRSLELGFKDPELAANLGVALCLSGHQKQGIEILRRIADRIRTAAYNLGVAEKCLNKSERPQDVQFKVTEISHPVVLAATRAKGLIIGENRFIPVETIEKRWTGSDMIHNLLCKTDGIAMNEPRAESVSVIVRTMNRPIFLEECLTSLADQTFKDFEVIVINDGGINVDNIIEKYSRTIQIIYRQHPSNRGRTAALNTGLRSAQGKYIAYLDDDDRIYPDHLEILVRELKAGQFPIVYSDSFEVNQEPVNGTYITVRKRLVYSQDYDRDLLRRTNYIPILNLMHRRDCVEKVGLFDENLKVLEDWDYWIRLSMHYDFKHIPRVTAEYRVRSDFSNATAAEGYHFQICRDRIRAKLDASEEGFAKLAGNPSVSMVILTCNQLEYTQKCLDSILEHTEAPFEIIIVDNGSIDGTPKFLDSLVGVKFPAKQLKVIRNKQNLGFAVGNNQGIAAARGEYILLMNNDIVVTPAWLDKLIACAERNPRAGIVGPMSNYVSGPQLVEDVDYNTQTLEGLKRFSAKLNEQRAGKDQRLLRVVGFCMLIKRAVIHKIGGMDDRYGLGNFEDDDFSLRAAIAGFQSWIAQDCFIHHFGHRTFIGEKVDLSKSLHKNWGVFKDKWGLPSEMPYGSPYRLADMKNTQFDPSIHHYPLEKGNAIMEKRSHDFGTAEAAYSAIQADIRTKRSEEIIAELENLVNSYPKFALVHNDLGVLYYTAGNKERAQQQYERAVKLMPDNINFQKNLADFYCVELGRIEDALKIYVSILKTNPQDVETLMATAQICVALGKPIDAGDFFNKVLEIEPWNESARQHLKELERLTSTAVLINSEFPDEIYQRLKHNLNTLSQAEAIDEFEKLLGSCPDFALGHNDLGVLYYHTGDKEKSLDHYRQAAQLQPGNLTFQKNLAEFLFVELGRIEEALQIYVDILALNPHDVETLLITGHICVALKKFDDARGFYLRVLELEPGNEDAGNNLQELDKHHFGNDLSPSEPANVFLALTDKVDSDDYEPDRSANVQQAAAVSIIISLDGIQNRVKECLRSVMEHTSDPHEILLINRGATKGILKWAQQLVNDNNQCYIIECSGQAGQTESINKAIKKASGEMVVLLHNDVVVPDCWLKAFKMCINLVPNIGVVGPMSNRAAGIQQMILSDESARVEFKSAAKAFYEQNQYRRVTTRKLSGFCLAFRRELPDKIGYFDEQFVSEEVVVEDFCNRAASGGYQNLIAADTYVHHYDRHPVKKKASTKNSANGEDQKKYKEKWNSYQNPEAKAFQTVQLLARAVELCQSGQTDAAVETVLGAIGLQPENQRLYLALSEILLTAKRFQDAKEALLEMPSADDHQEMRKAELLGYAEEGLENFETAQAHVEQVLAMNADRAHALNLKGILAYRNDNRHSAEKYFKRAIVADPGYGEPYTNLGMLQLEAEDQVAALKFFEKGFRLNPADLDIATNYHALIAGISEYEKAENVARDAAFRYPNNQKIKYMLIDFLVQQGKYESAMTEIEDAIIKFGTDNGILGAALKVREKLGPMTIRKSSKKAPVSLCMIIKDEEKYLARCLTSVISIVDEMIVIDTGSADRSKDIAIIFGAQVYDYEWKDDFGEARNYSIQKASGEWIFILDGDEVISPLDHAHFNQIVKKTPRAPVAYSITTRNYNKLANIVGWVPNDGQYPDEEAAIGWLPSEKVRLFYGKDHIWFEGAVHELVDPVLKRNGIEIKKCRIPVHHYGRLDKEKLDRKGEIYFDIGQKKLSEMEDDVNALRELAIQATILEKNQEAFKLWQRLLALNPNPNLAAIAYVNMGTIYNRLGKFEDALDAAQKAVECDPDLKEARYNQAMAELHCGNAPNTLSILEDLLSDFPDYPPAQFILSAAYCCAGQKEKGLEGIRKIKETPVGAHLDIPCLELAQSLMSAREMEYALWVIEAAIESDIVNPQLMALFKECLSMTEAAQKCSHIPQSPQANFQEAILENLPQ